MKRTLLLILAFLPILSSADDGDTFSEKTVEGVLLKYTIISESEKTCMVGDKYYPAVPTARATGIHRGPEEEVCQASGDITIPEEANGYRVVHIESYAFNQAAITSVFIPNSVETIGSEAFTGCADLKSVRLPMQLKSIESYTFYRCESLTSIDIPKGVTSIGEYAFACCKQLKEAIIPSSVEHFGADIFWNTGFTSLPKLPDNLTTIPNGMFYECTQLTSIEIPQNITRIGDTAFGRCPFSKIEIPTSVTHIGVAAFANCKNLTNIVIPDNVTSIGMNGFLGCSGLKAVTLSKNLSSLSKGVFSDCTSLESINIPNGVKTIGEMAFRGCSSLTTISIPATVESIESQVFFGCSSLTQLFIPKSVVNFKINKDENGWQYSYRSIIYGCNSLTSLVVDKDNPVYDSRNNCNAIIETASNTLIAGCSDTKIPEGITAIGLHAFDGLQNLTSITLPSTLNNIDIGAFNGSGLHEINIPKNVISIGAYAFSNCSSLKGFNCYAENVPETGSGIFYNTKIENVTLHVPAASVSAYQTVEPWKYFKEIVALSTQEGDTDDSDYLPFVEMDKQWNVVSTVANPSSSCHFEKYGISEEVERDGKTYFRVLQSEDNPTVVYDAGLYREENRRVYKYDETAGRDIMLYDFSLKEGDTFTYEMEIDNPVNCKVLKQGWLDDGPFVDTPYNSTDSLYRHRHLRTWTIGRENGSGEYNEIATWVECVGALENMFNPFTTGKRSRLAYIDYSSDKGGKNAYLPFSFCDIYDVHGQVHGSNIPTGAADNVEIEDWHHRLTYELEGDRLHVYGKVFCSCGVDHYAYFSEEETDDPMVRKLHFEIQNANTINALACQAFHSTDFYVPGFDPNFNYIVVDNQREEHPVINKTPQNDYRPFVEEGKVWKVGAVGSGNPVQLVDYYYFDGDTIINGKTCKQMMCQRYVTPDFAESNYISQDPPLCYVGAWYEEDKKVYLCNTTDQQFKFMYDFSVNADDTLQIHNQSYAIGPKQTGGLIGFKGVYRDVRLCAGGTSMYNTTWLEGVGGIDGPTVSVYLGEENHALFLMSCTVGDEVIYLNDEYEDKATPAGARKRFDFSHTIKTKPKARNRSEENLSLYGEYNDQQLGINLNPLDDAYLVSISDETGKVVYEKSVYAGNIVGLNIDISAYAKGHYTVIVENSDETFTGEFDAQATGIRDVRWKKEDGRIIIYNLQGQRLHSLQKGLNIVNGQKVFVK